MATLRVNGLERTHDGDPSMPLLWCLHDELGLTGTKFGCGAALCAIFAATGKRIKQLPIGGQLT